MYSRFSALVHRAINRPKPQEMDVEVFFSTYFNEQPMDFTKSEYYSEHLGITEEEVIEALIPIQKGIESYAGDLYPRFVDYVKTRWISQINAVFGREQTKKEKDVTWMEVFSDLETAPVPCCKEGCTQKVTWNSLKSHIEKECLFNANIQCCYCSLSFTKSQQHPDACPLKPVQCPTCEDVMLQHMVDGHVDSNECIATLKLRYRAAKSEIGVLTTRLTVPVKKKQKVVLEESVEGFPKNLFDSPFGESVERFIARESKFNKQ